MKLKEEGKKNMGKRGERRKGQKKQARKGTITIFDRAPPQLEPLVWAIFPSPHQVNVWQYLSFLLALCCLLRDSQVKIDSVSFSIILKGMRTLAEEDSISVS